ncbi:secondary thiamine-phosphate synthase [Candidatus Poribacteria bacterium]|nr:secondary thiamine-phosphate synthase [Candidatus Poribacteria bacterium]
MVKQTNLILPPFRRGFHLITSEIVEAIGKLPAAGLMNIFLQHTSAGITINENADPTVRRDFESSFNHLVAENEPFYIHTYEGSDDMPAHIKSALVGCSITIPITSHRLNLGVWQGIYLCEFRNQASGRHLIITIYG